MTDITIDLANRALIVTWLELVTIFYPLHLGEKAYIDRLHDVYSKSAISPTWNVLIPGQSYDERAPRPTENFKVIMNPIELIRWIRDTSAARGFEYSERQAANLIAGVEDYGF
jgi:hypothetical protein